MSVLIKGMTLREFAECLGVDKIVEDTNWFYTFYGHSIVEIPPHGRLIDADALEEELCDVIDDRGLEAESGYSHYQIQNAPTIIEAEEEKE